MTAEMYAARELTDVLDRAREEITQYRFHRAGRLVHELWLMLNIVHEELRHARHPDEPDPEEVAREEAPAGRAS